MKTTITVKTVDDTEVTFASSGANRRVFSRDDDAGGRYVLVGVCVEKVFLNQDVCFALDPMSDETASMSSCIGYGTNDFRCVATYEITIKVAATAKNTVQGKVCLLKLGE